MFSLTNMMWKYIQVKKYIQIISVGCVVFHCNDVPEFNQFPNLDCKSMLFGYYKYSLNSNLKYVSIITPRINSKSRIVGSKVTLFVKTFKTYQLHYIKNYTFPKIYISL